VRYGSDGMFRVILISVAVLAWSTGARADDPPPEEAPPAQETPPAEPAPAPQAEDREAPPMEKGKAKPAEAAKPAAQAPKPEKKPEAKPQPEPKPEAKPAPAEAAKPEPQKSEPAASPPRVTAYAYDEESTVALADTVESAVSEELSADQRLKFLALHDLLEPPEIAPRSLGAADLDAVDADDAIGTGDTDKAKQLLEHALTTYQKYLPELASRGGGLLPFRDAWLKLAKARFLDGDQKGARDAMRFVFVLDPTVKWDPKAFPPAMKKVVVESRLLYDTLGTGSLAIDSDPPGATVFLNGIKLDKVTPLDGVPAPAGPNYISFVRRGWQPASAVFEVAGGGEQATAVRQLEHYAGRPLQSINRARLELEKNPSPPTLKDGAGKLGVDMLVLVRLEKLDAGTKLVAYLYDARPNKILKRAEKQAATDEEMGAAARELAHEIMSGVPLSGVVLAPPVPKGPSLSERMAANWKKFRHSKAFWGVVGGVIGVVVVGAAVGIGVGVGSQPKGLTPGEQVVLIGGR
jgi:hypothetical protein